MIQRLLIFLLSLTGLVGYTQVTAKIGMSPVYSFTPSGAGTPSIGVQFGDTVNLLVYVKNSGNATFNGIIKVRAERDTTAGVVCDTATMFFSSPLLPNDSVSVILTFNPNPGANAFKSGGNGNTIVVWPLIISGASTPGDSVRPVVWINNINSIFEFEKTEFKIYPNPVLHDITIKSLTHTTYKNIVIYDVFARKIKETTFKEIVDVSDLSAGSYWMIINSEDKSYRINFIKE